jgi:hypothetical protein
MRFFIILSFALWVPQLAMAQSLAEMEAALGETKAQLKDAEKERDKYVGGAIRSLAEMRVEILKTTQAMLDQKLLARKTGAEFKFIIPSAKPNPDRAAEILSEIASATKELKRLKAEAYRFTGGLAAAMAQMSVITQRQTIAMLQQAYYANLYGLGLPFQVASNSKSERRPFTPGAGSRTGQRKRTKSLDPEFPDMDHSEPIYSQASENKMTITGRWLLKVDKAEIDDSARVVAINPSIGSRTTEGVSLMAVCVEGDTRFIVLANTYMLTFDDRLIVEYRFDDQPPESANWSVTTTNKGAGLFGKSAIPFLKILGKHTRMFVRISDRRNDSSSGTFDLRGASKVIDVISDACGWLGADLSTENIKTIQRLLKQAGFYAGLVDGSLGPNTRAAIIKYQQFKGIPKTGSLNRATLESLGWKPN